MTDKELRFKASGLEYKICLCDMLNQFAYEGNNGDIFTGGLSSLEYAFDTLGLDDPCKRARLWEVDADAKRQLAQIEKALGYRVKIVGDE